MRMLLFVLLGTVLFITWFVWWVRREVKTNRRIGKNIEHVFGDHEPQVKGMPGVKGPDPAEWGEAARIERGALPAQPLTRKERRAVEKDLRALLRDLED